MPVNDVESALAFYDRLMPLLGFKNRLSSVAGTKPLRCRYFGQKGSFELDVRGANASIQEGSFECPPSMLFSLNSEEILNRVVYDAEKLGFPIYERPRISDGFYRAVLSAPEGQRLEVIVDRKDSDAT